ncbi:hypothetical protein [Cellulomonas sp. PhB150]|uniref:hypothetical protein n=1 Tax=Cellulomonas sp. PhB150 TaxID=2485188 RepID=UPI000F4802C7|nr:hypothetical protein [Cellulomonas sp. PhB150]ROS22957.1 hypothetical protein EDF34_3130 [Cellulomonas sp. PhB150]
MSATADLEAGTLARVLSILDEGASVFVVVMNGTTHKLTLGDYEGSVKRGDVFFLHNDGTIEAAPPDAWLDAKELGVIRLTDDTQTVVEVGLQLRTIAADQVLVDVAVGNTVALRDGREIVDVVSLTPLRSSEVETAVDAEDYRVSRDELQDATFDSFGGYKAVRDQCCLRRSYARSTGRSGLKVRRATSSPLRSLHRAWSLRLARTGRDFMQRPVSTPIPCVPYRLSPSSAQLPRGQGRDGRLRPHPR